MGLLWGVLGAAHGADAYFGWGESRDKSFKLAVEYTDKALKLDETLSCATSVKGRLHQAQKQFEQRYRRRKPSHRTWSQP